MSKTIESELEKTSYALGMNVGQSFAQLPVELDAEAVAQGLNDALTKAKPSITQDEYVSLMQAFQAKVQAAEKEASKGASDVNSKEQADFLAKNKDAEGVVTTDSGLQYIALNEGEGDKPAATDTVRVHYAGTLLNGTEFDSSIKRGEPAEFGVGQVIKGWTEALQLMNTGSKYKLFIPSELAYGDRGAGQLIGPGAMLIFEVELLAVL